MTNRLAVIGNPGCQRVEMFCDAAEKLGYVAPVLISYESLLSDRFDLLEELGEAWSVRIESPGRNELVQRELVARGAELVGLADTGGRSIPSADELRASEIQRGRIYFPRLWYAGFRSLLQKLRDRAGLNTCWMNHPDEIALMFDKFKCQQLLADHDIPIPPLLGETRLGETLLGETRLGEIRNYDELRQRMRERGMSRVFVKSRHGSSASGIVALQVSDKNSRVHATTTVEVVGEQGNLELYNSRRLQKYDREENVIRLIDALAKDGVYAEAWQPKAGWKQKTFDLRIVVVGGEVRHLVMRQGKGPFTNLHLGNERADAKEFLAQLSEEARQAAMESCHSVAKAFPRSHYFGVDMAFSPNLNRHVILEVSSCRERPQAKRI